MNLIRNFENRVSEAFGSAPHGYTAPFSFKRLARQAAKQMEAETFVVDGVDTAPALYTVLVSPADDIAMRPLYARITQEVVGLVKAQAQAKGYVFVGEPLARFLVDPKLRSGKFAVFAENVDRATLERLRAEENAFLSGASAVGGAAADRRAAHTRRPIRRDQHSQAYAPSQNQSSGAVPNPIATATPAAAAGAAVAGAAIATSLEGSGALASVPEVIPRRVSIPDPLADPPVDRTTPDITVEPSIPTDVNPLGAPLADPLDDSASMGLDIVPVDFLDNQVNAASLAVPAIDDVPEVPVTQRRVEAVESPQFADIASFDDEGADYPVTCVLVDRQTGRTYVGTAPVTAIGRERMSGSIVLRDPNVSRRHAELAFDGQNWYIRDLNSTNGTLVNDHEVTQCVLRDGDVITVGLMNLEFREG